MEMYINGKKYYKKEMLKLSDEKILGKNVVFYKDRNYNIVYGFVLKNIPKLPKETTYKELSYLIGTDEYGSINSNNLLFVEKDETKEKVIELLKRDLKVMSFGSVNKDNVIKVINELISKFGYDVGSYSSILNPKPEITKTYYKYSGFLPIVSGDEAMNFYYALQDLGFNNTFYEAEYYWKMKKGNIIVEYIEGDVYLIIKK